MKDRVPESEYYHNVDGISGATLTGRGINEFLLRNLKSYEPYLKNVRNELKGEING
jgi:Na+-transporting NADH:ubiquinone oxidoreductase subunit NqrC